MSDLVTMTVSEDGTVVMKQVKGNAGYGYIDITTPEQTWSYEITGSGGWRSSRKLPDEVSLGPVSLRIDRGGQHGTDIYFTGDVSVDAAPGPADFVLEFDPNGELTGLRVGATLGTGLSSISVGTHLPADTETNLPQERVTITPEGNVIRTTFYASHPGVPGQAMGAEITMFAPNGTQMGDTIVRSVSPGAARDLASGFTYTPGECFLAGTLVSMWPRDPAIQPNAEGCYDEELVGSKVWLKPIEEVASGDIVLSYDKAGNLKPGRVSQAFERYPTHILDFWGTGVTPGHAYLCAEGEFRGKHVPIMDILRTDGAVANAKGELIRAATGCPVGSAGDRMVIAVVGDQQADDQLHVTQVGRIRLGTRVILENGQDVSVMDMIRAMKGRVTEDGYIQVGPEGQEVPFRWTFSDQLPKPEDYILRRSNTDLESIYQANEWESIGTRLAAPSAEVMAQPSVPTPNVPAAFADHPDCPKPDPKRHQAA